jgi:hypothetical protein
MICSKITKNETLTPDMADFLELYEQAEKLTEQMEALRKSFTPEQIAQLNSIHTKRIKMRELMD